ncbi:hypothetical protein KP509_38G048700 [Ceratopteris richardii]|nr:hypothetical protein KP509_38G048700 [Ceratopteris richardii]KAH7278611.1 hypothetical protein KP509_38G048700 [Ceratopteris richardii]
MEYLGSKSLIRLALVSRTFYRLIMVENSHLWKIICQRDLKIPLDASSKFEWHRLYAAAVDGSHTYKARHSDQHIDWVRVGTFQIESGEALALGDLSTLVPSQVDSEQNEDGKNDALSRTMLSNVRIGSWIADLHLVKCDICDEPDCNGTMQVFDARYWELLLHDEYKTAVWNFEELEEYIVPLSFDVASVGIVDAQRLNCENTREILKLKKWIYPTSIGYPATAVQKYAAAASTNITDTECANEGLLVKVYSMKARSGSIVAIRITQCLAPGTAYPNNPRFGNDEEANY